MEEEVPEEVANKMATKAGLDSLIQEVSSNDIKIIIKAGTYENIKDAVRKINEFTDNSNQNSAQVMATTTNQPNQSFNQNSTNGYMNRNNSNWNNNSQHGRNRFNNRNDGQRRFSNPRYSQSYSRRYNNNNGYQRNYAQQRGNSNYYTNRYITQGRHYPRPYTGTATPLEDEYQISLSAGSVMQTDTTTIDPIYNPDLYHKELKFKLQTSNQVARQNLVKNKIRRQDTANKKLKPINLQTGEKVYLKNENRRKLDPFYIGPYMVTNISNTNCTIRHPTSNKETIVHKNRLIQFN